MFAASTNGLITLSLSILWVCFLLQAHTITHPHFLTVNPDFHRNLGKNWSKHENKLIFSRISFILG